MSYGVGRGEERGGVSDISYSCGKNKKEVHKARVRDIRDEQLVIYSWLLCLKKNEKRGRTNYNRGSVEKKKIRSRFIDNHIGQNSRSSL